MPDTTPGGHGRGIMLPDERILLFFCARLIVVGHQARPLVYYSTSLKGIWAENLFALIVRRAAWHRKPPWRGNKALARAHIEHQ